MKKTILLAGLAIAAASVHAQSLAETGKKLFSDPQLGTNGKSCATCHKDGSGASLKDKPNPEAVKTVNRCIKNALQGKPLPADSEKMKALVEYLKGV